MRDHDISRRSILRGVAAGATGTGIAGKATAENTAGWSGSDRTIVGLTADADFAVAREVADEVVHEIDFEDIGKAVAGRFPEAALEALEQNPKVRYVEADKPVQVLRHDTAWGIDRVGGNALHDESEYGSGSEIAIIDTGIQTDHEDLDVTGGSTWGAECSDCQEPYVDDNGHGTHCAGIADALDNSVGVYGVSTRADLYAVKVLDSSGGGTSSDVARGLRWTASWGIDVASMSLGWSSGTSTLRDACEYAYNEGTLVVASAGNENGGDVLYPAAYDEVIAVSATERDDDIAYYSSTGPEVELAAPGTNIYSTDIDDSYSTKSGTSMAAPHVAGAGAQLMANGYSNTEARQQLRDTTEDLGYSSDLQGYGLLDAADALGYYNDWYRADVETDEATDVGVHSAYLNGTVTEYNGFDEVDVYFKYKAADANEWTETRRSTYTSTGSFYQFVNGLEEDTEYEYRAVASASDGDVVAGSTVTCTTTGDPTVTTDDADPGVGSVTFYGTLSDLAGADSATVYFEYRESTLLGTGDWQSSGTETLTSEGSYSITVSDLLSGTTYEYRAVVEASDGDSDVGATREITTLT